ncbi:MAG: hypothetical protein AB9846_05515 [Tenuifilaceae bacterium]
MKRILSLCVLLGLFSTSIAQQTETQEEKLKALESKDTLLTQKQDTIKQLRTKTDSTNFRIGKQSITIIDDDDNTTFRFKNRNRDRFDWDVDYKRRNDFKGHWAGFEIGVNGLMDKTNSLTLKDDLAWLDLKQARSLNVNINFMQYSIGFGTDKIGLLTGMGFEFNNYHFSNPITLGLENGITTVDSTYIDGGFDVQKTKLSTTHLTIPLILEGQIPVGGHRHRIHIAAGVIGGLRIGSHTKVIYDDNGKKKDKNRDDFNLATLRYGFTARIGFRGIKLYANYYPVQLFEKTKGPEVYPFSVGLVLLNFAD